MTTPLPRRRVVVPRGAATAVAPLGSEQGIPDASALYLRTLIRAQLRLAVTLAVAFAITLVGASLAIAGIPFLHEIVLWGVPLSWLLQAYGMYPLVAAFALGYVTAAARNERRYRALEPAR